MKVRGNIVNKMSQYFNKTEKHLYMMVYTRHWRLVHHKT